LILLEAKISNAYGRFMIAIEEQENFAAYGKRFRFVKEALTTAFPGRPCQGIRLLDVGCGNGSQLALPLARCGYDVTGIDLDLRSVEHARTLASRMPNAHFRVETVQNLAEGSFDAVVLAEVLEHVSDPKALLWASLRHLQAGGIVIVTVPNGYGGFEIDSWIYRKLHLMAAVSVLRGLAHGVYVRPKEAPEDVSSTDNQECGHVQFFTRKRLKRIFAECSLSVVREAAGSFLCGPIIGHTLAHSHRFIEWNSRIADRLPLALASGWYFVLQRAEGAVACSTQ
jgi:ubiquinone biosynthesis O-methyltransferase